MSSGWVLDPELGYLISFEEYKKRQEEKEKQKQLDLLVEAVVKAFTEKLKLKVDSRTGEVIVEKKE